METTKKSCGWSKGAYFGRAISGMTVHTRRSPRQDMFGMYVGFSLYSILTINLLSRYPGYSMDSDVMKFE